jgi:dTDP-4-dehydrorhamnose reductase
VNNSGDILFSRVLVTGANGLLGQALVRTLSADPRYDVLATSRDHEFFGVGASCGFTTLDVTDHASVNAVFEDFSPGVVVNCAAMTQVDACESDRERCWRVNVDAVENLARQCRATGTRFVQLSTDFVFDGENGPYRESDRPRPVNFYGRSKLASENVSREAGEGRWSVVRTILVFGCEARLSRTNIVLWVVGELAAGREIRVVTDQYRTPTYNIDLAAGIERLIRSNGSGIYHMSGTDLMSVHAFAMTIAETLGLDSSLIRPTDESSFSQPARRPARTGFDVTKAVTEIGYHPRSVAEAIIHLRPHLHLPSRPL